MPSGLTNSTRRGIMVSRTALRYASAVYAMLMCMSQAGIKGKIKVKAYRFM